MDRHYAIGSLLEVLDGILADAATQAGEALNAIKSGDRNLAIGTMLYLEDMLPTAQALYKAALTLHRQSARKGGAA